MLTAFFTTIPLPFFDLILIRAAVTFDAIVELPDTFLDVLATDICRRMFVAVIAGITAVIIVHMAGSATGVVITIKHKVFVVIKAGWRPFVLCVAAEAIARDLLM